MSTNEHAVAAPSLSFDYYSAEVQDRHGNPFISYRTVVGFFLPGEPTAQVIGREVAEVLRRIKHSPKNELERLVTEAYDMRGFRTGVRVSVTLKR